MDRRWEVLTNRQHPAVDIRGSQLSPFPPASATHQQGENYRESFVRRAVYRETIRLQSRYCLHATLCGPGPTTFQPPPASADPRGRVDRCRRRPRPSQRPSSLLRPAYSAQSVDFDNSATSGGGAAPCFSSSRCPSLSLCRIVSAHSP